MIQFDEHIFQLGWFNHQLVTYPFTAKTEKIIYGWKIRIHHVDILVVDRGIRGLPHKFSGEEQAKAKQLTWSIHTPDILYLSYIYTYKNWLVQGVI